MPYASINICALKRTDLYDLIKPNQRAYGGPMTMSAFGAAADPLSRALCLCGYLQIQYTRIRVYVNTIKRIILLRV